MALFIPTALDLAGWAGAIFAALALLGVGRLLTRGAARPEAALVAGWGAAALGLTLWGVALPWSLRGPAVVIAAAGIAAHAAPGTRLARADWVALARVAVLALPLVAVMASALPSEPDTFLNLLPNAAYLYDHASFPAPGRALAHSYLPLAPYNLQLAALIAGLVVPEFPQNALIAFNLVLQLAAGLWLARLAASGGDEDGAAPSWGATALGLLVATALNPGFVPRVDLAGYGEPSVTVTLAFSAWFAVRALEAIEAGRSAVTTLALLAFSLAALVGIKQDAIVLALAVVMTAAVLAGRGRARRRAAGALALASLPAAALYLAWRWYVLTHMPSGELMLQPWAEWQFGAVPLILRNMLHIIVQKGVFYGVLGLTFAAAWWRARQSGLDPATRMAALLAGCFVLYSAALVMAYVALFPGTMGSDAHSYFRYSTHLSLMLMAAVVLLLRGASAALAARWRWAGAVAVAIMLAAPLALVPFLRFDLDPPALRVWRLAAAMKPALGDHDRVALLLPGDNGSVAAMLGTVLRIAPPRRAGLDLKMVDAVGPDTLDALAAEGYRLAVVSCVPSGFTAAAQGTAALLERDEFGWHAVRVLRYPPLPPGHWSHVLSYGPLCLG
jgi:hypothetical protein